MTRLKLILAILLLLSSTMIVSATGIEETITKEIIESPAGAEVIYLIDGFDTYALEASYNINGTIKFDIVMDMDDQRLVNVIYNPRSPKKSKLMIYNTETGEKYFYNIYPGEAAVTYPIQFGNGQYEVKIYENTQGSSYKKVYSKTYSVDIEDSLSLFLTSHLEMNWDDEDEAIILANEMVNGLREEAYKDYYNIPSSRDIAESYYLDYEIDDLDIITRLYEFIINSIEYDYEKIETLSYDYLPDIDVTLEDGSGICYDYSTLFGSMLRSQGIPAKLIKGYTTATDVYHAWNQVYVEEEEAWFVIDTTFDAYYLRNGAEFEMFKDFDDYETHKYY